MSKPFKDMPAAARPRRFASSFFAASSSATAQYRRCSLELVRRFRTCSAAALVLFACSNTAHPEPIAIRPSGGVATTAGIAAFVEEASRRFAIPSSWIRAVMQAESGADVRALSSQGAMGLMQVMPATWAELRLRYGLGSDPYDPHDNITAGAAYLREMHDRFGEPGFLAAYNAGPDRYEEHVATGRPLPSETVSYMAVVGSLLDFSAANRAVVDTSAALSWASSPLFAVRASAGSSASRSSSGPPMQSMPIGPSVQPGAELSPHSDGLFASMHHRTAPR